MEDAVYFANILRPRECAVCGADRRATASLLAASCEVCHSPLDRGHAFLGLAKGAAKVLCSPTCLEVALQEGLVGGDACPACGTSWAEASPPPRTCYTCGKALSFEEGYVAVWEEGRLVPFCGPACLDMYRARVNPYCG